MTEQLENWLSCFPLGSTLKGPQNFVKFSKFIVLMSTCENNSAPHKNAESMPDCLCREGERRRAEEGRDRMGIIEGCKSISLLGL